MFKDYDDKDLAMIGIVMLGIFGAFFVEAPGALITGAITAIAALATGRKNNKE